MLEKEVLGPLSRSNQNGLFVYETRDFWRQIKSARYTVIFISTIFQFVCLFVCLFSATVAANKLYLDHYSKIDPQFLAAPKTDGPKIIAPVYIHPSARVDPTAVLGPNVSIDANCIIEAGTRIKEAVILPGVRIKENACVIDAIVGWNSSVGTWARVEGSPVASNYEDESLTCNGVKKPSVTILSKNCVDPLHFD
jgi:mannose-1-phosphate guanylyltransferase